MESLFALTTICPMFTKTLEHPMYQDKQVQESVRDALSWDPSFTAAHIDITVNEGVVTLTGHVENYAQKHAAEIAARRVEGVKTVLAEIKVRLPFDTQRNDDEIAVAAIERLAWDVSIPPDAIKVRVQKGWITLTGKVSWTYQREAAEQDVRRLFGVVGVSNQITIRPEANAVDICDHGMHALRRSRQFTPHRTISPPANTNLPGE